MAGETECCQEADEADDTQAQGLGVLIDAIERVRRVLLSGGELDADDVQALQNTGDVLIDFAGSLRGEDPLPSDRQRGLTEAEYRAVRFAVLRGMWTEGGICRHCGRREAAPDKSNPHAEWCVARVALAAAERLRGPTVPKGAAAADLEIAARRGQDPAAAEQAAMRAARDALIGRATVAGLIPSATSAAGPGRAEQGLHVPDPADGGGCTRMISATGGGPTSMARALSPRPEADFISPTDGAPLKPHDPDPGLRESEARIPSPPVGDPSGPAAVPVPGSPPRPAGGRLRDLLWSLGWRPHVAILHVRQGQPGELLISTNAGGALVDVVGGVGPEQVAQALALYELAYQECPTPHAKALRRIHAPLPPEPDPKP